MHESGTYGTISGNGYWIGEVLDNQIKDSENLLVDRFIGASTRSVAQWVGGPRVVEGTLTYHPQDMRLLFWAIGSTQDINGTGTAKIHYANQINTNVWQNPFCSGTNQLNAPISFAIEDDKTTVGSVFQRLVKGCVINSLKLKAAMGEKVNIEVDYIGQNMAYSGGATLTSVTVPSTTPYLWSNCSLVISGNTMNTVKDVSLEIAQNIAGPHYLNNSRDISAPILGNRDNTLSVTLDLDSQTGNLLYEMYKSNASFNSTFDLNGDSTTGSLHTILFMSGCKIKSMEVPSTIEGAVESAVDIVCPTIVGSSIDTVVYNPF